MDCDSRLIDYWLHSREFAHVDRVREEWAVNEKMTLSPTGEVKVELSPPRRIITVGIRTIKVPESEARFLATYADTTETRERDIDPPLYIDTTPFPIGDET